MNITRLVNDKSYNGSGVAGSQTYYEWLIISSSDRDKLLGVFVHKIPSYALLAS